MSPEAILPTLSVITVVYNNADCIERTLRSVLDQTYSNIEYIVIDGGSDDGTLDIIKRYSNQIDCLVCEPDEGIYDAMNKGLKLASGTYVLFMNSGDEIWRSDTVEKIFDTATDADIYYGETEMFDLNWQSQGRRRHRAPESFNWRSFRFGMNVSHQAIYIRRSLTEPFDRSYQLSADIDWIIRAAKKADKIVNVHAYVAKYMVGGMSKQRHVNSLWERFQIFRKYYGLFPTIFNHILMAFRLALYYLKHGRTND